VPEADILAYARREILFPGDKGTYRTAKDVSDGLEHGYADISKLFDGAKRVRDATAFYLRSAILHLSGISDDYVQILEGEKYSTPLAIFPHSVHMYLMGNSGGQLKLFWCPAVVIR
jgi:hypothetical protein